MNPYPFDFVSILWYDAETSHGWENESQIETSATPVETRGWFIKKSRKKVDKRWLESWFVGMSIWWNPDDEEYQFNSRVEIPKGMVKEMRVLELKNTPATPEPANGPS